MAADTLILTVFVYGPNDSRAEIEMRPKIPVDVQGNLRKLHTWSQQVVFSRGFDMKHSNRWGCKICGKPARETAYNIASWIHLPEPRIVVYIHQICEAGNSPCNRILAVQQREITEQMGMPPDPPSRLPKPAGLDYPMSSSCCSCQKAETAKPDYPMNRCGGCKLVRYCSTNCQTTDWSRHKQTCKTIESVQWVNWA